MASPINHGTRAGYKRGCTRDGMCMPNEHGVTCREASNIYQKELRDLRNNRTSRSPVNARTSPHVSGVRINVVPARPEGYASQDLPPVDMPGVDAPESLLNARVSPDPDPGQSPDYDYVPDFIITPGIKNDIAGKLGLFAAIIGMPLETMDDVCGPVFAANVDTMINSYLPIICRSPGAVKFFQSASGGWLDWIRAMQATWPVIKVAYLHHLAKSIGKDNRPMPDGLTPQTPDNYQYSAA